MKQSVKILQSLIHNDVYTKKVLPYLKAEYFNEESDKILFNCVKEFVEKYNNPPTMEAIVLILNDKKNIPEKIYEDIQFRVEELKTKPNENIDWLIDYTEKFCLDRSIYNGIMQSVQIFEGKDKTKEYDSIPNILREALSVSFNPKVGHDYFEDYEKRHEYYTRKDVKIPFDIDILNKITKGGVSKKTLNILMAGPNVGKSAVMCHMAAANMQDGRNVLYLTAEMSEEEISRRIDANLFDVTTDFLDTIPLNYFENKIKDLRKKTQGKLIVKEYATASAHVGHIRNLLNELNLKKNFVPDIIYIDYMNIFTSQRHKIITDKSYAAVKSISEEFRGLGVEYNVPIITATQFNRQGHGDSDPDETSIADSFGPIMTADLVLGLIRNEKLTSMNKMMFKQLKTRYGSKDKNTKFLVGFDSGKMKLYNVNPVEGLTLPPQDVIEDGPDPLFDNTDMGQAFVRKKKTRKLTI